MKDLIRYANKSLCYKSRVALINEKLTKSITLIIPCKNEAGTIGLAIEKGSILPGVEQLIVVEGNSDDHTHKIAKNALRKLPVNFDAVLLQQQGKGKWNAVKLGIEISNYPIISIWDADLTVSPEEQKNIHKIFLDLPSHETVNLSTGNRMATRNPGAMKFFNVLGNYFFAYLWSLTARQKIYDSLCGSKIFHKSVLQAIPKNQANKDPYGDFTIIAGSIAQGANINFVPLTYRARSYGQSNIARWRGGLQLLRVWFILTFHLLFKED